MKVPVKKIALLITYYILGYVVIVNIVNCFMIEHSHGRDLIHIAIAAVWGTKLFRYYFPLKKERIEDD